MTTTARENYEDGFASTSVKLVGILAFAGTLAVEGEKVPYLKGVVAALRSSLEAAEASLLSAELAQDRAVSIREEYGS